MVKKGLSFRSILFNSLWTTLTGILLFSLSTTKRHNFGYSKFFSVCGTLLVTLPWMIQLLVTSFVIVLHKTRGYDLMWIVQSPTFKENGQNTVLTVSSPSFPVSSSQVLKKNDRDEIEIRIVIGAHSPRSLKDGSSATPLEIEGRNNNKLLTNGSLVT